MFIICFTSGEFQFAVLVAVLILGVLGVLAQLEKNHQIMSMSLQMHGKMLKSQMAKEFAVTYPDGNAIRSQMKTIEKLSYLEMSYGASFRRFRS